MQKKSIEKTIRLTLLVLVLISMFSIENVMASSRNTSTILHPGEKEQVTLLVKDTVQLKPYGSPKKKVKWKSSKKKVVGVTAKGVIKAKREGKATITGKYKKKKYKIVITVISEKSFTNNWIREWINNNIKPTDNDFYKVLTASSFVISNFKYGKAKTPMDVITSGVGTCKSGGLLLVEMLTEMGFKANLRFAANDNMSRYPFGMVFMEAHHNVAVEIYGNTYYVDGTPNSGVIVVYLSSETTPLYFGHNIWGYWLTEYNLLPE